MRFLADWRAHQLMRQSDVDGGAIYWWSWGSFGAERAFGPCGTAESGIATVANTDVIEVVGERPDVAEKLLIDQVWDPPNVIVNRNVTDSAFAGTGIVFRVGLGVTGTPDRRDELTVRGSGAADQITVGTGGLALDALGTMVQLTGAAFPGLRVEGGYGNDRITAEGSAAAGASPTLGITVDGELGRDVVIGGAGDNLLVGNTGNDEVTGGPGRDRLMGDANIDILRADDGEADLAVDGGNGTDTAYYDAALDTPVNVETLVAGGGSPPPPPPPPPPPGPVTPCGVAPATLQPISLTVQPGTEATLKLVDGEFWFGTTPERCEGFTTSNVQRDHGQPGDGASTSVGTTERLIIDLRGGIFAPGGTETDAFPEIELTIDLGDATDQVVIFGTESDDVLTAGLNGVSLNTDNDVDVSFAQQYALELHGVGGRNKLSGAGGLGAGSSYLGPVSSYAGDLGDTLYGGSGNDQLYGGAGPDVLDARVGNDVLLGAGGNDSLTGNVGDDELTGGAGVDSMSGNDSTDTIRANDDEADTSISGGAGIDTAYYDVGVDPSPFAVETKVPA